MKKNIETFLLDKLKQENIPSPSKIYVPINSFDSVLAYNLMITAFPVLKETETEFVIHRSDFESDNIELFKTKIKELGITVVDSGVNITTFDIDIPASSVFQHIKWAFFKDLIPTDSIVITGHRGIPLTAKLYEDFSVGLTRPALNPIVHSGGRMYSPLRGLLGLFPGDVSGSLRTNIYTPEEQDFINTLPQVLFFIPNPDWLREKGLEQTRILISMYKNKYSDNFDIVTDWENQQGKSFFRKPPHWREDQSWWTLTELL